SPATMRGHGRRPSMVMKATTSRRCLLLSASLLIGCQPSAERLQVAPVGYRLDDPTVPHSPQDLHARMLACIRTKEAGLRELASEPQAFFGSRMKDLPLPVKR